MNQSEFDTKLNDLGTAIDALAARIAALPPPAPPVDFAPEGATVDADIAKVNAIAP